MNLSRGISWEELKYRKRYKMSELYFVVLIIAVLIYMFALINMLVIGCKGAKKWYDIKRGNVQSTAIFTMTQRDMLVVSLVWMTVFAVLVVFLWHGKSPTFIQTVGTLLILVGSPPLGTMFCIDVILLIINRKMNVEQKSKI